MNPELQSYISNILKVSITRVSSVHGGDISKSYRIDTSNDSFFLKCNRSKPTKNIFQAEVCGLQLIRKTNTIKTPKVLACDTFQNESFLLMEFIRSKSPSSEDFKNLGQQLANLHKCTADYFGLDQDNLIGSLHQSNHTEASWVDFYVNERLLPQLKIAKEKNLLSKTECPEIQDLKRHLEYFFTDIKPSLLHGDLWHGNYLISNEGTPYLIDPAVYYGHHEVDIAMTKLFGGFGESFYQAHNTVFKQDKNTSARIEIYQLYYLLVHLNLFGSSYYDAVSSILQKYF